LAFKAASFSANNDSFLATKASLRDFSSSASETLVSLLLHAVRVAIATATAMVESFFLHHVILN
jgi:hypothetical protein